jgi:FkbM family methyltransferase
MNTLHYLFSKSLAHFAWQEFLVRYRFKYVLPKITETTLDGVRLDLSTLSLKVRNRILMGIYEAHEKQMCQEYLAPDDAVVEIGSAIGFVGLICQKVIGIQRYFSFEANPATLEVMRRNYALNGLTPIAWNLALGPQEGFVQLEVSSDFWENSVFSAEQPGAPGELIKVAAAPLRRILELVEDPVNVLIIDVEGAEQFIDLDEIPSTVTKLIIELHPKVIGPRKTYDLISGLVQRGFSVESTSDTTFALLKR